jgi:hypothetical protein
MPTATFSLALPHHTTLLFYEGEKNRVLVTTDDGLTLSIPWKQLQPHVHENGVHGKFKITFDETGKCLSLIQTSSKHTPVI